MTNEVINLISACGWDSVKYLFISGNVFDPLIYYSHLLPLVSSLVLVVFLYIKSSRNLATKVLFATIIVLDIWLLCDLIIWATDKPSVTMYLWSMMVLLEPIVYAGLLYFLYLFIDEKDISFVKKSIIVLLLAPTILFASTKLAVLGYDISNCDRDAVEGPLAFYGYFIELVFVFWMVCFAVKSYINRKNLDDKRKIVLITIGTIGFLLAFSFGNVVGSLFDTNSIFGDYSWTVGQYGIFGVPVFLAFLAYVVVKYKTFNTKIFSTQLLVGGLVVLVGSEFFFVKDNLSIVLTAVTLFLSFGFGVFLIRSVRKEIEQRERIEKLAVSLDQTNVKLREANLGQANLMHFMNHQVKGRLGIAKNIFAELLTTDYGTIPAEAKPLVEKGLEEVNLGVNYVQSILKGASAESGTLPYDMKPMDFRADVEEVVKNQKLRAESKGLKFSFTADDGDYKMRGDVMLLGEAVKNLIDNSIHYTPSGSIDVVLKNTGKSMQLVVKDTGVGITDEDKEKLFKSGGRGAESIKINVDSTGYGLVFVKKVIEEHKGTVSADSEGKGKGSTFTIDIPRS